MIVLVIVRERRGRSSKTLHILVMVMVGCAHDHTCRRRYTIHITRHSHKPGSEHAARSSLEQQADNALVRSIPTSDIFCEPHEEWTASPVVLHIGDSSRRADLFSGVGTSRDSHGVAASWVLGHFHTAWAHQPLCASSASSPPRAIYDLR